VTGTASARRRLAAARPWLLAAATYLAGAVIFTWPLAADLSGTVWGDRFDAWTTMWLIWHLGDALASGDLVAHTDRIFFPVGYNLWSFGHLALQLMGAPLIAVGFAVATVYNLLLLFAFTASGLAAHALGRHLSGDHWGGLLCGAVFAWNPYLYGEMSAGCVELVAAWFFPLQGWLLLRLFEAPGWRRALPVGAVLAATGPFNWYYTLFCGMFMVSVCAWRALLGGSNRLKALGWAGAAVVAAGLSNLPLIPLVRQETPERYGITAETFAPENWDLSYAITNGAIPLAELDEEALVLNDAMQVAINSTSLSNMISAGFVANPLESTPGALAFAAGLFGLLAAGRRGYGWAAIAGGFLILTLGPFLQLDATPPLPEWSIERPLPYYFLYNDVPFFSKAYRPYRLGVVVLTALAALSALGYGRLSGRWRPALAGGLFLAGAAQPHWAGERPAERPIADADVPEIYHRLRELPDGAVIELPLHYQPLSVANARLQYYQVVHRKPMLNCNQLIRRTELMQFRDYVAGNRFLQVVLDIGRSEPPYTWSDDDLLALRDDGFRYVVFHDTFEPAKLRLSGYQGEADRLRQPAITMLYEALGEPVLEGDGVVIFALPGDLTPGRERAWTGEAWAEVELPWTALELPLKLAPGAGLPLSQEDALVFSAWLHRLEGDSELALVSDDPPWSAALRAPEGRWAWTQVEELPQLAEGGTWRLEATDGPVTLELDAVQLLRGPR
jgi:hypothetical protein